MGKVTDIVKHNECNLTKKEVGELGQQSTDLDSTNRRLRHIVKILKNPNNFCELLYILPMQVKRN